MLLFQDKSGYLFRMKKKCINTLNETKKKKEIRKQKKPGIWNDCDCRNSVKKKKFQLDKKI